MPARFPLPYSTKEHAESLAVIDANGFPICYFYFSHQETAIGTLYSDRLTKRQAYAMARLFVKAAQAKAEGKL